MRSIKQFLLWAGMGALALTPCAYGRSISGDSTVRGAVQEFTFQRGVAGMPGFGESAFLNPDSRLGGDLLFAGHLALHVKPAVRVGHSTLPGKSDAEDLFIVFNTPTETNTVPTGNSVTTVPEGGTSVSYLVPAALVMFGGIFLTGWRRQRTPWQVNS